MGLGKYILLEGLRKGNRFFATNVPTEDQTRLEDGSKAYKVLGYADTCREAQLKLYGWSPHSPSDPD